MMAEHRIRALKLGITMMARSLSSSTASVAVAEPAKEGKRLYRRLSALPATPNGSVEETMSGWLKEGKVVTESELTTIIKELRRYKNYKHALEVTNWMEKRGMEITFSTHAVRIDLISKVKGIDMAEKYFSSLPEVAKNQKTYGALFNGYCQAKMEDKAISLYEKMKELNLISSALMSNSLLTLYMKLGQPERVPPHFEEMKAANISPDKVSYGILMNSYASMNDTESVEKVIEEMRGSLGSLDWSTYCNLASYYNKAGFSEKADSALKKAEEVMKSHDRTPYDFLLTLYAACGNLAEVKRVWKSLKSSFTVLTNNSYFNMFHALRKLGDMDALKQLFQEWESVHNTYDIKLVNVVIDAYLSNDMLNEASALWKKAIEKGVGSDFWTLELFSEYYMKKGEFRLALKSLKEFTSSVKPKEFKPNKEKMIAFLRYFEGAKDVDGAEELCECLKKLNCLDAEAYESLLRTYVVAGKKNSSILRRIEEDGIDISSETEKLLEKVCATV